MNQGVSSTKDQTQHELQEGLPFLYGLVKKHPLMSREDTLSEDALHRT